MTSGRRDGLKGHRQNEVPLWTSIKRQLELGNHASILR